MTPNFNKLIDTVQGDIALTDMLYQWANTPTGITALDKGKIPNHGLIKQNLICRYNLDKEKANSRFEEFQKIVEDAGFNFNSGYIDATLFVNQYISLNPILKLQTLSRLASAIPRDGQIVWLYCKFKDQWLQYALSSYWDENRENGKKSFKKFSDIFKIMFDCDPGPSRDEITHVLVNLGFINKLDWFTSTHNEFRPYIFSSYLEDVAQNIDKYVNVKGAI